MKFRSVNDGVPSDNFERDAVRISFGMYRRPLRSLPRPPTGRCSELSRGGVGSL